MKKRGETFIADDFEPTETTRTWIETKYPVIDIEATIEKFCDDARAKGWMYRDWQAALKTVIRKGMENGWRSIVTLKTGREHDPKWMIILHEARKHGFREPHELESVGAYRTQFEQWKTRPRESGVIPIAEAARRLRVSGNS